MNRRIRYEVLPTSKADRKREPSLEYWSVSRNGGRIGTFRKKADAVQFAVTTARAAWKTMQQLGQVLIKNRAGKIRDERTYGADPITSKG